MADVKISALPAATTPLAGTEVLPIVQSATTKQVSIANVTAGRAISASSLTLTTPLSVANGGTGLTSLTAGYIPYATATNTLGTSANLTFDGTAITTGGINTINDVSNTFTYGRYSSGYPWVLIRPTSTASGIEFRTNAGNAMYQLDQTNDRHLWYTSGTEKMRIASDGSVGIGTSSSSQKLTVAATNSNSTIAIFTANASYLSRGLALSAYASQGYDSVGVKYDAQSIVGEHSFSIGGTTFMKLDASGNLGLGVTPSAWGTNYKASEVKTSAVYDYIGTSGGLVFNAYYNGTNWIYKGTGGSAWATRYEQGNGHFWFTAASGSAGSAISFTQAMTLDASGNLGVGATDIKEKLDCRGAAVFSGDNTTGTNAFGTACGLLLSTSSDNTTARITAVSNGANNVGISLRTLSGGGGVDAIKIEYTGVTTLCSGTATPASGSTSARLLFGTTAGFGIYYGSGVPTVSAAQGSIYLRSDGSSTSTRLYVNTNGSTTWTNVTTAA